MFRVTVRGLRPDVCKLGRVLFSRGLRLSDAYIMGVTVSSLNRTTRKPFGNENFSNSAVPTKGTPSRFMTTEGAEASMIEVTVGQYDDMKDGEMKTVELGEQGKALLVRENGEYTAVGHKCTHFGAPLAKGNLFGGRIRCPWHGACFNIKTGDIEDFPGIDSLPKFEVVIKNDNVIVRARPEQLKSHKRVKQMTKVDTAYDKRVFVIIGGGGAAMKAAEALREEGFKGRVVMVTKEVHVPYDRTILSKKMTATAADLKLRSVEYLTDHGIEFISGTEAVGLDKDKKTVNLSNGDSISYDSILVATGGKPRSLDLPGANLENIRLLRSPDDANKIASLVAGKNAVVIGNSFIGMEVAAFMSDKASSVTVIGRSSVPFESVLGKEIGTLLKKNHENKGVKFLSGLKTSEFKGKDGKLCAIGFDDGTEIPADVCVLGVGVTPATEFLKGSGVPLSTRGTVLVDQYMKACDGVYAAGDIATFPLKMLKGEMVNIGHWQLSHKHGLTAARNMLGRNEEIDTVPFFWTMLFGKSVRYAGHASSFDDVIIDGSLEEQKFVAYYVKKNAVLAVATMGRDPVAARAANRFYAGKMPSATEIRTNPSAWLE